MKTDKELAVDLAVACISSIPMINSLREGAVQPLSGNDVMIILHDCFSAVRSLDMEDSSE